jgi:hypothetical protein
MKWSQALCTSILVDGLWAQTKGSHLRVDPDGEVQPRVVTRGEGWKPRLIRRTIATRPQTSSHPTGWVRDPNGTYREPPPSNVRELRLK